MTKFFFSSKPNLLSIIIILFSILLFYCACYYFTYNFFYQDDFHLLRAITFFQDDTINFKEKLDTLWSLQNEHRIVFPRLITWLGYLLQGHLDWQVLNTFAALYYFGIFFFFTLIIRKQNLPMWFVIPVALFVFQPASYENFYWTTSILQQVGVVFWAMFLFYSLVYFPKKYFWFSLVLMVIDTFTHGNGLFVFLIGIVILILQKRYKHLTIWILLMVITVGFYFKGYYTGQNSNLAGSLSNPIRLIGSFGAFWGIAVKFLLNYEHRNIVAILEGLFVFGILFIFNAKLILNHFFVKVKNKYNQFFPQENLFLMACFFYFSIAAGLVALSRSWISIEAGFQIRYLHNSVFAFVLLYVTLLHFQEANFRKFVGFGGIVLGFMYWSFGWYTNFSVLNFQKLSQETDAINYQLNAVSVVNDKVFNQNIDETMRQSFKDKVSIFPKSRVMDALKNLDKITIKQKSDDQIDIKKDSSLSINAYSSRYRPIFSINNLTVPYRGNTFIVFQSESDTFVCPVDYRKSGKFNFLTTGKYYGTGFNTTIMTDAMPRGEYKIGILFENNTRFSYQPTTHKIVN